MDDESKDYVVPLLKTSNAWRRNLNSNPSSTYMGVGKTDIEISRLKSYFVTMEEGAGFDLDSGIEFLGTHGIAGCVALMIHIIKGNKQYIFLTHIEADLLEKVTYDEKDQTLDNLLNKILYNINDYIYSSLELSDFSIGSNNKLYLTGTSQIGLMKYLMKYLRLKKCYFSYIFSNTIGFYIEKSLCIYGTGIKTVLKVSVVDPYEYIQNLIYIGERQFGYGPVNIEYYNFYTMAKNLIIDEFCPIDKDKKINNVQDTIKSCKSCKRSKKRRSKKLKSKKRKSKTLKSKKRRSKKR